MRPRRIIVVSQNPSRKGGSDAMFLEQVTLLRDAGHEVLPFCALDSNSNDFQDRFGEFFPKGADFDRKDVKNLALYISNLEARRKMVEAISYFKPDVCHLHNYYGKITASILKPLRDAGIPCVQTLHDYRYSCAVSVPYRNGKTCSECSVGRYFPAVVHRCNRGSVIRSAFSVAEMYSSDFLGAKGIDRFVCVSNAQRGDLLKRGLPAESSLVIYNTVDKAFRRSVEQRRRTVLYVGRIEQYKGVDLILEVANRIPDAEFLVVGDGNYKDAFLRKARSCRNLTFKGELSKQEVAVAMSQTSCLIFPSQWEETFGLVAAEAMACGTPVVGSDIGGIPEVITDGVDGFLASPGNCDEFEYRVRTLLDDTETWTRFSAAGVVKVRDKFSGEAHLGSLIRLYDELTTKL